MSSNLYIAISSATMHALLDFQREQKNCERDPAALADLAIRDWLERQREPAQPASQRGYFWKKVFLPDGTRLRVSSYAVTRYAAIVGDDLVHNGMTMSPNRFAQMSLGSVRNAWHAIRVLLPGEREWKLALRLRYAAEAQARRSANRPAAGAPTAPAVACGALPVVPPTPITAPTSTPSALASPVARALPKTPALPADMLYVPQLRPDAEERRRSHRRAEDLLLD
jgi:hypothetical protein